MLIHHLRILEGVFHGILDVGREVWNTCGELGLANSFITVGAALLQGIRPPRQNLGIVASVGAADLEGVRKGNNRDKSHNLG